MPNQKSHKFTYLTGSVQLFIGLSFLFIAFLAHHTVSDFKKSALQVSGKVVRFQKIFNKKLGADELYPAIEYNYKGKDQVYFLQTRFGSSTLKVGETVNVLIDPKHEDRVKVGSFEDMYASITALFFMGSFFFMMGLFTTSYFGRKQKMRNSILSNGRVVFAKIIEIREEKIMPFGKSMSYKLIAEYADPFKGKTYHFESEYLHGDWKSEFRPEIVKVFILPEDESQYIVDLSSLSEEVESFKKAA